MICDRCGAKYTKKAAQLHVCSKRRARLVARFTGAPRSNWTQLDLFDEFARRGMAAQTAVDALTKRRRHG